MQEEKEAEKDKAAESVGNNNNEAAVATLETGLSRVSLGNSEAGGNTGTVATLQQRQQKTLPARELPERSVRLMKEKGMLRKYD